MIASFTSVHGRIAKGVDSEDNCNYIDLQAQLVRYESHLHTVLIKLNEVMQTLLKRNDY